MRILIAEDDLTSRSILAAVLKKAGHEPVETTDGSRAWEELQKPEAPRLVILDWMMPKMDGLEVLRRVRALSTDSPPYIIMLTSKTEKAEIIAGLDAGANDYLAKPFDSGELRARVEVGRRMVELQDEIVRSREALAHQAAHDPLTGALNRRAVLDVLARELNRAIRNRSVLSIGLCDIDHFKRVNDTYGHQAGDEVLCGFVKAIKSALRPYDSVGRYGGEEFLIVAPGSNGPVEEGLYERMRARAEDLRTNSRAGEIGITVSIGVAFAGIGIVHTTVDSLLAAADEALYEAKNRGRNRVVHTKGGLNEMS